MGGYNYHTMRSQHTKDETEWWLVPGFDAHPNKIAHGYIAEYMHNGIKKIYEN